MRATVCLCSIVLVGCSQLLGIEDPAARIGDAGSGVDAPVDVAIDGAGIDGSGIDGPAVGGTLVFSIASVNVAKHQGVRLHVLNMHDGTMEDVTTSATLASGDIAIATVSPGQVDGVFQGSTTVTASLRGATPATLNVVVKEIECHPVINEFATAGATAADEWVEVFNPCTTTIDVDGWTLNYRAATAGDGTNDSNPMATLVGAMTPFQLRLYVGLGYTGTDTPDGNWNGAVTGIMKEETGAIGLRAGATNTGPIVDAVAYGDIKDTLYPFLEGSHAPTMTAGISASRLPFDGKDDDDGGADFKVSATARTPHTLNVP